MASFVLGFGGDLRVLGDDRRVGPVAGAIPTRRVCGRSGKDFPRAAQRSAAASSADQERARGRDHGGADFLELPLAEHARG